MSQRLAIFTKNLGVPSETFIRKQVEALAPGRTVAIVNTLLEDGMDIGAFSFPLYKIKKKSFFSKKIARYLRKKDPAGIQTLEDINGVSKFLKTHNVSVMLGQYLDDSWPYISLARKCGIRFFAHAHGYDLSMMFKDKMWRNRYADYAMADGVIVVNKIMRERLISIGVARGKIHIIPYGVNVPALPLAHPEESVFRCLAVGRMVAKKAPLKLLEAFRLATERNPRLHLDYIGAGPLTPEVNGYINEFNLNDCVTLHGLQTNDYVLQMMKKANCFLQHSTVDPETGDEEGVPVAILEAMSMALPVVSTLHAGIPEAVLHGKTGFLVEEGDTHGMADFILRLSADATLRYVSGRNAWNRAQEKFSWEKEKKTLSNVMGL